MKEASIGAVLVLYAEEKPSPVQPIERQVVRAPFARQNAPAATAYVLHGIPPRVLDGPTLDYRIHMICSPASDERHRTPFVHFPIDEYRFTDPTAYSRVTWIVEFGSSKYPRRAQEIENDEATLLDRLEQIECPGAQNGSISFDRDIAAHGRPFAVERIPS